MAMRAIADQAFHTARKAELRGAARRRLQLSLTSDAATGAIVLRNISRTGALIRSSGALQVGEQVDVDFPELGTRTLTVRWREGSLYGCRFASAIPASAISAALLRADPLQSANSVTQRGLGCEDESNDKLSLPVRMRFLVGLTLLSWAAVLGLAALTF